MHLQTNTMPGAVNVVFRQASYIQGISSQGIGGLPLNTCIETCLTCLHGIEDSIIDLAHTRLTGFTNTNGTSHIGAIALVTSAHVNGDKFPALDAPLARVSMGHRTIRARGYNRFKRRAICA